MVRAKAQPAADDKWTSRKEEKKEEYLLVDGYNIIFAWEELKELAKSDLKSARDKLMDVLCNYQGYKKCTLILVFDAYKVEGGPGICDEISQHSCGIYKRGRDCGSVY